MSLVPRRDKMDRNGFKAMGRALGYERVAESSSGSTIAPYDGSNAYAAQSRGSENWEAAGRGPGRHSEVGQPHVRIKE